jgi:tetratricopeptide (TPR) repeat protein
MQTKNVSVIKISLKKKIALIVAGVVSFFIFLEIVVRMGGFVLSSMQEYRNRQAVKQKGVYSIMCLGESTTQRQYPWVLEEILNKSNIGVRFRVIDEGKAGSNTWTILSNVESQLDECRPDLVVAMMGINDLGQVVYYKDIPESGGGIFGHCRAYRFMRLIAMHIAKKFNKQDIQGAINNHRNDDNNRDDRAHIELGRQYRYKGKYSEAEDSFKKAIEIDPKDSAAYSELGWLYRDQGRYRDQGKYSEAEDFFKRVVDHNPNADVVYVELGRVYRDQGKYSEAEDSFKKAVGHNPENDHAYAELGQVYRYQGKYRDQGKYSEAEDFFANAIERNPQNGNAYVELGLLYRDQGKYAEAADSFKKAIELNPKNDKLYRTLTVLYEEMGKPELANEYTEKLNKLRLGSCVSVTVSNYRKLKEILDKRGIRLVCVQYPMRNVEPLKNIFKQDEGVIFVDNESLFKEAVKKISYKDYFIDMFGGDFGHCTKKGNRLLARNIADTILREVFHKLPKGNFVKGLCEENISAEF